MLCLSSDKHYILYRIDDASGVMGESKLMLDGQQVTGRCAWALSQHWCNRAQKFRWKTGTMSVADPALLFSVSTAISAGEANVGRGGSGSNDAKRCK